MKPRSAYSHLQPLTMLAAVTLMLSASLASAQQTPLRSVTSPARAATVGAGTPSSTAPNQRNPVAASPGGGTATLPLGAPSPSGLASPSPFPAGISSTSIAAPGTSAAITAPTTVSPSVAGGGAIGVTSSTRGVVGIPGVTGATGTTIGAVQPLDGGAVGPAGNTAALFDPSGAAAAGNAGAAISVGTPGAPSAGVINTTPGTAVITPGTVVGGIGGLTGGVPSVTANAGAGRGGPLTALQVSQFFMQADTNADGLLSRAEALRLPMATMTFEDMDTNRDGSVSRSEYDDSLR
ncbi:hypothetical protein EZ313_09000 [Ramlibacter henchirensis]|uniref:EF-hand domain-containing protein n=1 Tax=Ramlibacter henchirensis TaxID=204072 RepID=A0A4Z0C8I6_9BURK|nr:hypothetical protein [Ramlibacter henchirensis]TFZ06740.1 hypothetical protein EZ313_09000 [Ramlibacter henchirensis]